MWLVEKLWWCTPSPRDLWQGGPDLPNSCTDCQFLADNYPFFKLNVSGSKVDHRKSLACSDTLWLGAECSCWLVILHRLPKFHHTLWKSPLWVSGLFHSIQISFNLDSIAVSLFSKLQWDEQACLLSWTVMIMRWSIFMVKLVKLWCYGMLSQSA